MNPKNNNLDGKIKVLREMEKMHCTIGVLEEKNKHQQQMLRNLKAADFTLEEENRTLKSLVFGLGNTGKLMICRIGLADI